MDYVKRLMKIMLKYWDRLLLGIISVGIISLADGFSAGVIKKITDIFSFISTAKTTHHPFNYVFNISTKIFHYQKFLPDKIAITKFIALILILDIGANLLKSIFIYGKNYGYNSLIEKTAVYIRTSIYKKIIYLPVTFFDLQKTGDLTAKITNDVEALKMSLLSFVSIILDSLQALFFIVLMFVVNWELTLFTLLLFPITAVSIKKFSHPLKNASQSIVENISNVIVFLQESLQGVRIIKIFSKEKESINKFGNLVHQNYSANMKRARITSYQKPLNDFISSTGVLIILAFFTFQILYKNMTLGSFLGYFVLVAMAYKPLKNLSGFNESLQRTIASSERVFALIDKADEKDLESKNAKALTDIQGNIEFKNVAFGYKPDKLILKDISFSIKTGENLAIVGPSGTGKTTLVNLIPRFYDTTKGEILLDGLNIQDITFQSLRNFMAVVPQDIVLFSGTIFDNIKYAKPDAKEEEIIQAAKNANAHNFITKLPKGYQTNLEERGLNLSGGEKQRIAIARAILKDPKILILDEATSALDTESELLVQEALAFLMKNRTTFVIAHRLSTIRNADRIIVIDDGIIKETGTHQELYKKENGLYKKLCDIQFKMK